MKQPISVYIDPEWPLAYVQYLDDDTPRDGSLSLRRDGDGVVRDYTFAEMNDVDSVAIARDFAADNDLGFPSDIRAAAKAGDPAA
jgi:hypothetical protein